MSESLRSVRHGGTTCEVFLGRGLLDRVAELTAQWPVRFALIGEGFFRIHERRLKPLGDAGVELIVIPDGEREKTLSGVEGIVTKLLDRGARRDATVIAIGGGVTGDMAGFAAAVFMRGVRLVHVPTTLLAQVDSSIGGKTGVNHAAGKNLIGAFHPAVRVISDVEVLRTLPRSQLLSGVYEALKSGVIGDAALFDLCVERSDSIMQADPEVLEEVVRRSIAVKADIVERDEREADLRKLLNYGHTIGHGIEAALGYEGLTHGEAIAWGMIGANAIAKMRGLVDSSLDDRMARAILSFKPSNPGAIDPADIFAAIRHDKKFSRAAGMVMALPVAIGECRVVEGITVEEIRHGIDVMLMKAAEDRQAPDC